jgi:enoyl-CoA hydratase/carnithine racemase
MLLATGIELHEGGWASLALERLASLAGLLDALESLREQAGVRCVLLSGERFETGGAVASEAELRRLALFELPLVFAFEGELTGVACEVALACDIRVCGPEAAMRPDSWTKPRERRLLGQTARHGRLEGGTSLTAREALVLGLVSHVADGETAMNYASRLAATIASRGPIATRLAKEAIWRGLEMPLEQALRFETDLTLLLQTTEDRAEGVRAFIEKRAPKFTGD